MTYELFGPLANVGAHQADIDSSNLPELLFSITYFMLRGFTEIYDIDIENYFSNLSCLYECTQDSNTYGKICMGHFDTFRRPRRFQFFVVLVLHYFVIKWKL